MNPVAVATCGERGELGSGDMIIVRSGPAGWKVRIVRVQHVPLLELFVAWAATHLITNITKTSGQK